jgi:hypothetical protein
MSSTGEPDDAVLLVPVVLRTDGKYALLKAASVNEPENTGQETAIPFWHVLLHRSLCLKVASRLGLLFQLICISEMGKHVSSRHNPAPYPPVRVAADCGKGYGVPVVAGTPLHVDGKLGLKKTAIMSGAVLRVIILLDRNPTSFPFAIGEAANDVGRGL